MAQGILAEDREEYKYPKWLCYLAVIYAVVLLWTLFSLPPTGYDIDSAMLVLFLWLPAPIGLLYIVEKPAAIGEHKKAMRIVFTIFTIIAIFLGLVLSYAFME
jgi:hypothetical protein